MTPEAGREKGRRKMTEDGNKDTPPERSGAGLISHDCFPFISSSIILSNSFAASS